MPHDLSILPMLCAPACALRNDYGWNERQRLQELARRREEMNLDEGERFSRRDRLATGITRTT